MCCLKIQISHISSRFGPFNKDNIWSIKPVLKHPYSSCSLKVYTPTISTFFVDRNTTPTFHICKINLYYSAAEKKTIVFQMLTDGRTKWRITITFSLIGWLGAKNELLQVHIVGIL